MIDIFHWANNVDGMKRDIDIELFLFNKNYTPYSVRIADTLQNQIPPTFLYDVLSFVEMGAGTGLSVRELEDVEDTTNILPITSLDKVGRAETLIHLIDVVGWLY